jgi:hypothetical protein
MGAPSHCPRRSCARHRRHAGGDEQGLQDEPTCLVRSDVHRTAAHKNWARLIFGNLPGPAHLLIRTPSLISIKLRPRRDRLDTAEETAQWHSPVAKEEAPAKDVSPVVATAKADTKKSKHYKPKVFARQPRLWECAGLC